jgi:hypothetical protein
VSWLGLLGVHRRQALRRAVSNTIEIVADVRVRLTRYANALDELLQLDSSVSRLKVVAAEELRGISVVQCDRCLRQFASLIKGVSACPSCAAVAALVDLLRGYLRVIDELIACSRRLGREYEATMIEFQALDRADLVIDSWADMVYRRAAAGLDACRDAKEAGRLGRASTLLRQVQSDVAILKVFLERARILEHEEIELWRKLATQCRLLCVKVMPVLDVLAADREDVRVAEWEESKLKIERAVEQNASAVGRATALIAREEGLDVDDVAGDLRGLAVLIGKKLGDIADRLRRVAGAGSAARPGMKQPG